MVIDFAEIIGNKLEQMKNDKVIEKQIEESIETVITKAVKDACEDYSFKRKISEKIETEVSGIVNDVGFTGYNQFIADTFGEIINGVLKEDIKNKVLHTFDSIFINKVDKIKMSEIAEKYREMMMEMDDSDKYEHGNNFHVSFDEKEDADDFRWITVIFALESQSKGYGYNRSDSSEDKLEMRIHNYKDGDFEISSVSYENKDLSKLNELRYMSEFESFIASLYFNKTKIELDIDEDDIDTSLGLDC